MRAVTEDMIRASMINMSADDLEVMTIPGLHETVWDEREFLGWRDAHHKTRGYLVFWAGEELWGLMVRAAASPMPSGRSAMCVLCHTHQPAPQVSLFTAPKTGEAGARGASVGTYLCADLACSLLIRVLPVASVEIPEPQAIVTHKTRGMKDRLWNFSKSVRSDAA